MGPNLEKRAAEMRAQNKQRCGISYSKPADCEICKLHINKFQGRQTAVHTTGGKHYCAICCPSHRRINGLVPAELGLIAKSGDTDIWLTPPWILEALGPFDLDPCACDHCPMRVAPRYFTEAADGLSRDWTGRVFMNPPYSNTAAWIEKHAEYGRGVSLVPASVESIVWRKCVWAKAKAIYLLHGRTRFCALDGSTTTGRPLRSVALIGWDEAERKIFGRLPFAGTLLTEWDRR